MKPETYLAKVRAALDKSAAEKLATNERRIAELEAQIKLQEEVKKYNEQRAVDTKTVLPPLFTKGREMGVTIKEVNDESPVPVGIEKSVNAAALLQEFNQSVQLSTSKAVEQAMGYANKLSTEIIENVKLQLAGVSKPRVMVVEIDAKQFKLSKPATKFLPRLLTMVKLGQCPVLVGPAGSGKSVAIEQLAEALGQEYAQLCCTEGMSETWIFGRQTPQCFCEAPFSRMFREGGCFNLEEIDAAGANVLLSINTALASGILYNPISGQQFKRHPDFYLAATANTVGKGGDGVYTARNRLDGSTLTRFRAIRVDYDEDIEARVCPDDSLRIQFQNARKRLREMKSQEIISTRCLMFAYQEKVAGTPMEDIIATQTLSWPEGLAEQVGMLVARERSGDGKFKSSKKSEGVF